ncbi:MAG: hypothetical protein GX034_03265 [Clostridiaceae bacterium]|nr:hypothetical protein [Clostridiaceae bacterium]
MADREDIKNELNERLEAFRFFELKNKKQESGDRFLLPWIYTHMFGAGRQSRDSSKRAAKEINLFFNQKELREIEQDAGDLWLELIDSHLQDSALRYLKISKSDPSFGRKFLGLLAMSDEEKDNKIFRDVYSGMITLLLDLPDFPYQALMVRALDESFLTVYPERQGEVDQWLQTLPDPAMREIFRR